MVNKKDFEDLKEFIDSRFKDQNDKIDKLTDLYDYESMMSENNAFKSECNNKLCKMQEEVDEIQGREHDLLMKIEMLQEENKSLKTSLNDASFQIVNIEMQQRQNTLRFNGLAHKETPIASVQAFLIDLNIPEEEVKSMQIAPGLIYLSFRH